MLLAASSTFTFACASNSLVVASIKPSWIFFDEFVVSGLAALATLLLALSKLLWLLCKPVKLLLKAELLICIVRQPN